jgi:hypothetical protein
MSSFKRESSDGKQVQTFIDKFKEAVSQKKLNTKYKQQKKTTVKNITDKIISKCLSLYTRIFTYYDKMKQKHQDPRDALVATRNHYRRNKKEIIKRYLSYIREDISTGMAFLYQAKQFPEGDLGDYEISLRKIEILKTILNNYNDDNRDGGTFVPKKHWLDDETLKVTDLVERHKIESLFDGVGEVPTGIPSSTKKKTTEVKRVAIEVKRKGGSFKLKKRKKKNTRKKKRN